MLAQAFLYNSIFFSYGLILEKFHGVAPERRRPLHRAVRGRKLPRPALLGRQFDRWGRRVMIPATYALSGVLLLATGAPVRWRARLDARHADARVVDRVLRRVGGRELRVPDGERAVPGRAARHGDRGVLRVRRRWSAPVAPALFGAIVDTGEPGELFAGYALAVGADDRRRGRRARARRRRRGSLARGAQRAPRCAGFV